MTRADRIFYSAIGSTAALVLVGAWAAIDALFTAVHR